jgi:hypothetical protein
LAGWLYDQVFVSVRPVGKLAYCNATGQFGPRGELSKLMNFHLAKPTGANQAELLPIAYLKYFRLDRHTRAALPASNKEFELFVFQLWW